MTELFKIRKTTKTPEGKLEHTFAFPFTDRESYLAWKADWKEQINAMAADQKRLRKEIMKGGDASREQSQRCMNAVQITQMIAARHAASREAQRQYEQSKAAVAAE